jgi:glutaconyl-CoA/methylmalonyl-CoA decarboxylase subunit delta
MNINWSDIFNTNVIITSLMTVILIAIIFTLYRFLKWISVRFSPDIKGKLKSQEKRLRNSNGSHAVPADHSAAIALALYLNNELHDEESNILTIERVSRIYSPWSSKYYNMRKPPR